MNKQYEHPQCALCAVQRRACVAPDGKGPESCPTTIGGDVLRRAFHEYQRPENQAFARAASRQEAECYANRGTTAGPVAAVKPRIQEVIEFSHKMGYRRLGLAFCAGLKEEARIVARILRRQGFEVVSVVCKVGAGDKSDAELLGLAASEKIHPGAFEAMCNPIAQAMVLADEGTEFNLLVGLCVGHDSLFLKYSQAPTSVLVVKDRVTGHNPLAAIMLHRSYYSRLEETEFGAGEALDLVKARRAGPEAEVGDT
jgi:uncharacterized metal-binding protein